jgi:Flp pilus assembly protein TadD
MSHFKGFHGRLAAVASRTAPRAAGTGRYAEAIGFYQQAFALNPTDINVSTDLGTALWYVGRADEALAQY